MRILFHPHAVICFFAYYSKLLCNRNTIQPTLDILIMELYLAYISTHMDVMAVTRRRRAKYDPHESRDPAAITPGRVTAGRRPAEAGLMIATGDQAADVRPIYPVSAIRGLFKPQMAVSTGRRASWTCRLHPVLFRRETGCYNSSGCWDCRTMVTSGSKYQTPSGRVGSDLGEVPSLFVRDNSISNYGSVECCF